MNELNTAIAATLSLERPSREHPVRVPQFRQRQTDTERAEELPRARRTALGLELFAAAHYSSPSTPPIGGSFRSASMVASRRGRTAGGRARRTARARNGERSSRVLVVLRALPPCSLLVARRPVVVLRVLAGQSPRPPRQSVPPRRLGPIVRAPAHPRTSASP